MTNHIFVDSIVRQIQRTQYVKEEAVLRDVVILHNGCPNEVLRWK